MKLASLRPHLALWGLRGAWALAVALWALALVPWFKAPPPQPPAAATTTWARSAAAALTAAPVGREPVEELIEPSEPASLRAAAIAEPVATARGAGEDLVCGLTDGVGGAAGDAPTAASKAAHWSRQAGQGLQQVFDTLRTRADPASQAAAWWLRVLLAREGGGDVAAAGACAAGAGVADCAATAGPMPPLAASVDALAQLAQASNDAWVQQVAQRACEGIASAACASLGTRRWSTLQPDNAAAWLELAARDPQAVDEALYRSGKSNQFDAHPGRLVAQVLLATPEQAPAMQRYAAWQRANELERASDARTAAAAVRVCSDAARRDTNRDQLCETNARWLVSLRPPPAADVAAMRSLDCATIDRQWREARDGIQRGTRLANSSAGARP